MGHQGGAAASPTLGHVLEDYLSGVARERQCGRGYLSGVARGRQGGRGTEEREDEN